MKVEFEIAKKYSIFGKGFNFIKIITFLSVIGITVGVAAIIIVSSIFNGFQNLFESQLLAFDPHIRITSKIGDTTGYNNLRIKYSEKYNANSYLSTEQNMIMQRNETLIPFKLIGISHNNNFPNQNFENSIFLGKFSIKFGDINFGAGFANDVRIFPGESVSIITPKMVESFALRYSFQVPKQAIVASIFSTRNENLDRGVAITGIDYASSISGEDPNIILNLRFPKLEMADEFIENEKSSLSNFSIQSWKDLNRIKLKIMEFENIMTFLVLSIIIVIAVFNIFAALAMTVLIKKRDLGILKTIGMSNKSFMYIILLSGMISGIVGTTLGISIGVIFTESQNFFGLLTINVEGSLIKSIPTILSWKNVLFTGIFSLFLTFVAAYFPAKYSANLKPSDCLNYE